MVGRIVEYHVGHQGHSATVHVFRKHSRIGQIHLCEVRIILIGTQDAFMRMIIILFVILYHFHTVVAKEYIFCDDIRTDFQLNHGILFGR